MPETAVTDLDLPPGVRLDPRRGRGGGQYVILTCPVCGREIRCLLSRYLAMKRQGRVLRACSLTCSSIMRRKLREASGNRRHVDEVDEDLPPWVRLDAYRGPGGGRYVIVTCVVCGRETRLRISEFRSRERKGFTPRTCSRECAWVLRRELLQEKKDEDKRIKQRPPRLKNLPLTYDPKALGVYDGTIRQTIRVGRRYIVGDGVSFHCWTGKPYRSKWSFRTPYMELTEVIPITLYPGGIEINGDFKPWSQLDDLARLDGIDPPTGEALGEVLNEMHRIPDDGMEAQILRW